MHVIYKHVLSLDGRVQEIEMPKDAEVISCQVHDGDICVWTRHRTEFPDTSKRKFYIVGTGQPFAGSTLTHVGTVLQPPFVWHVFVEPARAA